MLPPPELRDDRALYLDHNGSTPVHPEVRAACIEVLDELYGNPSAPHAAGARARARIDLARAAIARFLCARAEELTFTSGGTESNNWALQGVLRGAPGGHLVVSAIEHKSVLSTARALEQGGVGVTHVPVDATGRVRVEDVERALRPETRLVSVMVANNETGALQPAAEIGALCRRRGVLFHTDAVAAIGRVPLDVEALGCDLLSLSSHKLYAPKGSGILYVRAGTPIEPLIHGCGQQAGLRGGTENALAAVGFGRAIELQLEGRLADLARTTALRDRLWSLLSARFPRVRRNGGAPCLGNTLNVCFPGTVAGEVQAGLARAGISVSAGAASACAAPSHVLLAMGLSPEDARASLRFSLGAGTTSATLDRLVDELEGLLGAPARSASALVR
jgi:cysteine desulfurase